MDHCRGSTGRGDMGHYCGYPVAEVQMVTIESASHRQVSGDVKYTTVLDVLSEISNKWDRHVLAVYREDYRPCMHGRG